MNFLKNMEHNWNVSTLPTTVTENLAQVFLKPWPWQTYSFSHNKIKEIHKIRKILRNVAVF